MGPWDVHPQDGLLNHADGRQVQLTPLQMKALVVLASQPGSTVSRQMLSEALWEDAVVEESGLTRCISELRSALGDNPRDPEVIATMPRRGYRLLAPVSWRDESEVAAQPRPAHPRWVLPVWTTAGVLAGALLVFTLQLGTRPPNSPAIWAPVVFSEPASMQQYQRARQALRHLQLPEALGYARQLLATEPRQPEAWMLMAEALFEHGEERQAQQLAAESLVVARTGASPVSEWLQARQAFVHYEWDTAIELVERLLLLHPANQDARYLLARAHLRRGDIASARKAADNAILENDLTSIRLTVLHAEVLQMLGRHEDAHQALTAAEASALDLQLSRAHGIIQRLQAGQAIEGSDFEQARELLDLATAKLEEHDAMFELANVELVRSALALRAGRHTAAEQSASAAESIFRDIGSPVGIGRARLASLRSAPAISKGAGPMLDKALVDFEAVGDQRGRVQVLQHWGEVLAVAGDLDGARARFDSAYVESQRLGDVQLTLSAADALARCQWLEGNLAAAALTYGEVLRIKDLRGDHRSVPGSLLALGAIHADMGNLERASVMLRRTRELAEEYGDEALQAQAGVHLASVQLARDSRRDARKIARSAYDQAAALGNVELILVAGSELTRVLRALHDYEQATSITRELEAVVRRSGADDRLVWIESLLTADARAGEDLALADWVRANLDQLRRHVAVDAPASDDLLARAQLEALYGDRELGRRLLQDLIVESRAAGHLRRALESEFQLLRTAPRLGPSEALQKDQLALEARDLGFRALLRRLQEIENTQLVSAHRDRSIQPPRSQAPLDSR